MNILTSIIKVLNQTSIRPTKYFLLSGIKKKLLKSDYSTRHDSFSRETCF